MKKSEVEKGLRDRIIELRGQAALYRIQFGGGWKRMARELESRSLECERVLAILTGASKRP